MRKVLSNAHLRKYHPCEVEGLPYPPIMIKYTDFAKQYFYTYAQVRNMIFFGKLFCVSIRNRLFVCPNPYCPDWNEQTIRDFWK
jgi:hypothetical protein